ncbi:hypothetical protein BDD12DRAFT_302053 [Trichophaea hybrida]|nr:hypothetical protein BDD12DRAFT_302053 [Trichophaea hybrida]
MEFELIGTSMKLIVRTSPISYIAFILLVPVDVNATMTYSGHGTSLCLPPPSCLGSFCCCNKLCVRSEAPVYRRRDMTTRVRACNGSDVTCHRAQSRPLIISCSPKVSVTPHNYCFHTSRPLTKATILGIPHKPLRSVQHYLQVADDSHRQPPD